MSRLYKKCFIAASGLHVLLALILITCPAFLASKPRQSDVQLITFIPDILTESPFVGGGDPNAGRSPSPTPAPPAPQALPKPAPAPPEPKPQVKEVVPPKTVDDSLEVDKNTKPTKRKPEISLTPVVRKPNAKPTSQDTSEADNQAREQSAKRNRILGALDRSLGNIKSSTGSATKVEGSYGPGGGGPSYAGYEAWVLTVFDNAWVAPEDASSEDAMVWVSVTIASDGRVVAKRITKRSGDQAVDSSVQRTLDKVSTIGRAFPEGSKDKERTYLIPFNMKTKRGTA
jgi:TonB family protein